MAPLSALAGLAAAAFLVLLVLTFIPSFRAQQARRMSTSVGLALEEPTRRIVERAIAIRTRAGVTGALLGLGGGLTAATVRPSDTYSHWVMLAGLFLGLGLGLALGALLARPRSSPTGARVARSRDVRLRDYVMPIELVGARVLVSASAVIAVIVAALLAGNPRETTSLATLVTVTVLALAALAVFEIAGRAIIAQPSPATDPSRLAWEDALRADTLRNLATAPLTFGCVAVVLSVVGAFGALPLSPLTIVLGAAVPMLLLVAAVVVGALTLTGSPQRHFLRVLWPETAAALTAAPQGSR